MDPITLITGALSIADALGLDEWFGNLVGGKPGAKVASKVVEMAKAATGANSAEEAVNRLKTNSPAAQALKSAFIANEHELALAAYEDRQSARQMYQGTDHAMTDKIAKSVINLNPLFILLLVSLNAAVIVWVENPTIAVAIGNVIGISIGQLWQERQAVINFFFGSSQGSKQKTQAMQEQGK